MSIFEERMNCRTLDICGFDLHSSSSLKNVTIVAFSAPESNLKWNKT